MKYAPTVQLKKSKTCFLVSTLRPANIFMKPNKYKTFAPKFLRQVKAVIFAYCNHIKVTPMIQVQLRFEAVFFKDLQLCHDALHNLLKCFKSVLFTHSRFRFSVDAANRLEAFIGKALPSNKHPASNHTDM